MRNEARRGVSIGFRDLLNAFNKIFDGLFQVPRGRFLGPGQALTPLEGAGEAAGQRCAVAAALLRHARRGLLELSRWLGGLFKTFQLVRSTQNRLGTAKIGIKHDKT